MSNIVVIGQLPAQVFRLRRKTPQKQKEIAFDRKIKFGVNRGSRAANHDLCKTGAAERSVFPKGVNGSQGQRPPVPCGSEGKPDFPLKPDQILFLFASR